METWWPSLPLNPKLKSQTDQWINRYVIVSNRVPFQLLRFSSLKTKKIEETQNRTQIIIKYLSRKNKWKQKLWLRYNYLFNFNIVSAFHVRFCLFHRFFHVGADFISNVAIISLHVIKLQLWNVYLKNKLGVNRNSFHDFSWYGFGYGYC